MTNGGPDPVTIAQVLVDERELLVIYNQPGRGISEARAGHRERTLPLGAG